MLFWAMGAMIQRFSSILLPLAVACVLALVLKPYHVWLENKLGGRSLLAVLGVYLSVLLPFTLFTVFFGAKVINEGVEFVSHLPEWADKIEAHVQENLPAVRASWQQYDVSVKLKSALEQHGTAILTSLTKAGGFAIEAWSTVFRSVAGLLGWFVLPIYLAFFMMGKPIAKPQVEGLLPFLKEDTRKDISYLVFEFLNILVSFFRGQLIIAFLQGLLFAVGFSLSGLQYGFSLGLVLGFLNVIPYLGSMVGLSIAIPLAFFQPDGGVWQVGLVLLVFTVVQCIEGYVLTPKIMGDRTGLHPLAIIIAIFFWGSVFGGITGMILAIPLTAFLVVLWRLAKTKYIREVV